MAKERDFNINISARGITLDRGIYELDSAKGIVFITFFIIKERLYIKSSLYLFL